MTPRFLPFALLVFLASTPSGAQDAATYALTPAAAEKFVRATQQMVASGATPNVQGNGPYDLSPVKTALDSTPAAQQALAGVGLSSGEYVAFMGAAMAAMMVQQMEAAGMRGMLPPGMTARPSQPNLDFMRDNTDLFERSMRPGAPPSASAARVASGNEDVSMPAAIGAVLPSSILARLTPLDAITDSTDCSLGGAAATVEAELSKVRAQMSDYYGNPGDRGLERTPAEGAVLERAGESALMTCGFDESNGIGFAPAYLAAQEERSRRSGEIAEEQQDAWNACPGIPGGKDPACERAVNAAAARQQHDAERQFLAAVAPIFAANTVVVQRCTEEREAIVRDARAANVRGANIHDILQVLSFAWERTQFLPAAWTGICENAQHSLIE
jgi:hypothetical protein